MSGAEAKGSCRRSRLRGGLAERNIDIIQPTQSGISTTLASLGMVSARCLEVCSGRPMTPTITIQGATTGSGDMEGR